MANKTYLEKIESERLVHHLEMGIRALTSLLGTLAQGKTIHQGMMLDDARNTLHFLEQTLTKRE